MHTFSSAYLAMHVVLVAAIMYCVLVCLCSIFLLIIELLLVLINMCYGLVFYYNPMHVVCVSVL